MKRHAPEVRQYMTHLPFEAERCQSAEDALAMMREHNVHHVPVMSGSHLRGIVSKAELSEARITLGETFSTTPLDQLCQSDTLVVSPVDPVDSVARCMLQQHTNAAAVVDGGFVVGLFTTTDALRFIDQFFGQS